MYLVLSQAARCRPVCSALSPLKTALAASKSLLKPKYLCEVVRGPCKQAREMRERVRGACAQAFGARKQARGACEPAVGGCEQARGTCKPVRGAHEGARGGRKQLRGARGWPLSPAHTPSTLLYQNGCPCLPAPTLPGAPVMFDLLRNTSAKNTKGRAPGGSLAPRALARRVAFAAAAPGGPSRARYRPLRNENAQQVRTPCFLRPGPERRAHQGHQYFPRQRLAHLRRLPPHRSQAAGAYQFSGALRVPF